VFDNGVLRRIFGPEEDEVTGDWRRLHNEELHCLCSSKNIIRVIKSGKMRWAGHVEHIREIGNACRVLMGKSGRNTSLGRPMSTCEGNIKMYLKEI
jgi:hypothetical protein